MPFMISKAIYKIYSITQPVDCVVVVVRQSLEQAWVSKRAPTHLLSGQVRNLTLSPEPQLSEQELHSRHDPHSGAPADRRHVRDRPLDILKGSGILFLKNILL